MIFPRYFLVCTSLGLFLTICAFKSSSANSQTVVKVADVAQSSSISEAENQSVHFYNQAIDLVNLKKYDQAIVLYAQTIKLNPRFSIAWNNRGNAIVELKRYEDAIKSFKSAI